MLMDKFDLCYDFLIHITPPPLPHPPLLGPKNKNQFAPVFKLFKGMSLFWNLSF